MLVLDQPDRSWQDRWILTLSTVSGLALRNRFPYHVEIPHTAALENFS
jgi:hypothetical protein